MLKLFDDGQFDVCTLFFAEFKSVMSQKPTALQLIPASVAGGKAPDLGGAIYDAEPDEGEILADLLPRNIAVQIFRALLENAASEQGARMSAMDSATRNAGDMINKLSIQLQPAAPGADHQRTHRNHFGRGSALDETTEGTSIWRRNPQARRPPATPSAASVR